MNQSVSIEFIIYLCFNVSSLYAYYYYFETALKLKKTGIKSSLIYYSGMLIVSEALFFIFHNNVVNLVTGTLLLFLVTQIYRASQIKKITSMLILVAIQMGIELITVNAYALITSQSVEEIVGNERTIFILGAVSKLVLLVAVQLLPRIGQNSADKYVDINWKGLFVVRLVLLPVISIVVLHSSFVLSQHSTAQGEYNFIVAVVGILFMNVLFVFIFDKLFESARTDSENKMLSKQIQYYEMHWQRIENEWNKAKTLRHNLKYNLMSIKSKIDDRDVEGASIALTELLGENSGTETVFFSQIHIVNVVLNYESDIANKKNIAIKSRIFVNGKLKIKDEIISVILGNAIDNAIAACEKVTSADKEICVTINNFQNNLYIAISNPYEQPIKPGNAVPSTTKKDEEFHGIGLKTIAKIVEQENGMLNIDFDGRRFDLEIILFGALA